MLSGGEDYELLATLPAGALDQARAELGESPGITEIGRVLEGEGAAVLGLDGERARGRRLRPHAGVAAPGSSGRRLLLFLRSSSS